MKDRAIESHRWADTSPLYTRYATHEALGQGSNKDIGTIDLKEGGSVTHSKDMQISQDQANDEVGVVRLEQACRRGTTICGAGLDQQVT